jgi:hypothetical protein
MTAHLPTLTGAQALKSIVTSYKRALMTASGATASLERSAPGSEGDGHRTRTPRDFGSDANEIEHLLSRLAHVIDRRFGQQPGPAKTPGPAISEIVLSEAGSPAIEVAFLYGVREDYVEKIRTRAHRDPKTGEQRAHAPLTAPARETARRHALAT